MAATSRRSRSSTGTILITLVITSLAALLPTGSHAMSPAEPPSSSLSPSLEPAAPPMESGGAMAPGPAEDPCLTALFNMSDCLTYVEQGSQLKKPDDKCCPELAGLVDSQPVCLCKMLANTYSGFGIQINFQKALGLPTVCRLGALPVSACSALGYPVNLPLSPSGAPSGAPVASPEGSTAAASLAAPAGEPMEAPGPPSNNGEQIISINLIEISLISLIYTFLYI